MSKSLPKREVAGKVRLPKYLSEEELNWFDEQEITIPEDRYISTFDYELYKKKFKKVNKEKFREVKPETVNEVEVPVISIWEDDFLEEDDLLDY